MAKNNIIKKSIVSLLITVGGWAVFSLLKLLLERAMIKVGIIDPLTQMFYIVIIVIVSLALLGYGFRGALRKLKLW